MKKFLRALSITVISLVLLVAVVLAGFNLYLRIAFSDFYGQAQTQGKLPGIADGFIHQGITYVPESKTFLSCGYMKDGSASRIYLFDGKNESYVPLATMDGQPNISHAGGLAYWKDQILLTDGDQLLVYNYSDLVKNASADTPSAIQPTKAIPVGLPAAFCYVDGDELYVGEFYREQNYPTDASHHLVTPAGEQHHALMARYDLTAWKEADASDFLPVCYYSIPDLAQGMCVTASGRLCISTSYAIAPSHIYVFSPASEAPDSINLNGSEYPLYYLDSSSLQEQISLFPMSEELVTVDGQVYIMNESASAKYIFGKFTGGNQLYHISID